MDPLESVKIYKDFGVAALFIVMYTVTVWFLIRYLIKQGRERDQLIREVVKALESSASSMNKNTEVMTQVKASTDENIRMSVEFVSFLKGRDRRED